jgi:wobble nucleotide-excising tRNase
MELRGRVRIQCLVLKTQSKRAKRGQMLERIELIQGTGLLHDAHGSRHRCHKATLVFADNGRGKSTLASVLRSASTADASSMNTARTLDGTLPPKVTLQFGSGHRVSFENGVWSEARPELLVFDATFVEQNVHSGGQVTTTHRKNLLDFALGQSAVAARGAMAVAAREAATAGELVLSYTGQLTGYHAGFTLNDFKALQEMENVDGLIADAQRRLNDATNVAQILAKHVPHAVPEPEIDFANLFSGLARSVANVHEDAERIVKEQVERLGERQAERWLSEGHELSSGGVCPYCNQDVSVSDLIRAYQTHFDEAYNGLKDEVARLVNAFTRATSDTILDEAEQSFQTAAAHAEGWQEHVPTGAISFVRDAAALPLSVVRLIVSELLQMKVDRPADPLGTGEQELHCAELWTSVLAPIRTANLQIASAREQIEQFKNRLSSEDVAELRRELNRLGGSKRRYEPAVVALFADLEAALAEQARANTAKQAARSTLDGQMQATLSAYQTSINDLLGKFGAGFRIANLGANFRGAAPRSEYGITLRGRSVPLEGGPPSFATALSEGDKRTLAFAFFVASTLVDPNLTSRVVVIDDPMCSLDRNRKRHTLLLLKKLYEGATQLIVLAHDPFFLRDLGNAIRKSDDTALIGCFRLVPVANEYTSFGDLDLDKECESPYSRHHRMLNEFVQGEPCDPTAVAKAIRPMLEGYLHRRFPGLVPTSLMFGQVVDLINHAVSTAPLCHAQNLTAELNEINDYAGQFHHDADLGSESVVITASELRPYVDRALAVVHKGAPLYSA